MALVIGENSFLTLEEAQDIVQNELYSDSSEFKLWESMDDKSKEIVCKRGTIALNSLNYIGVRNVYKYSLKFPRVINNIEIIPYEIKVGTVINGLLDKIVKSGDSIDIVRKGIKSMTVGPNKVVFDDSQFNGSKINIYDDVISLIDRYIIKNIRM